MQNKNKQAPICLFTFNRLEETIKTVEALQNNFLALKYDLKIFSDGPRNAEEEVKVKKVRNYLQSVNGFKTIEIFESENNKGLAASIIHGVTAILETNESVIVLEDDLITSPNYLDFMEQALAFYREDKNILTVTGYTMNLPSLPETKDVYFGYRSSSWGWGTWKERWDGIDWKISDYDDFIKDKTKKKKFKKGGADLVRMLKNQMEGTIDSWAIRLCYNQFKNNQKTVFPTVSKIASIGFGSGATHTIGANRLRTKLDTSNKKVFQLEHLEKMDERLVKEFAEKFSFWTIFKEKTLNFLKK